jgi:hypothetical protein
MQEDAEISWAEILHGCLGAILPDSLLEVNLNKYRECDRKVFEMHPEVF